MDLATLNFFVEVRNSSYRVWSCSILLSACNLLVICRVYRQTTYPVYWRVKKNCLPSLILWAISSESRIFQFQFLKVYLSLKHCNKEGNPCFLYIKSKNFVLLFEVKMYLLKWSDYQLIMWCQLELTIGGCHSVSHSVWSMWTRFKELLGRLVPELRKLWKQPLVYIKRLIFF